MSGAGLVIRACGDGTYDILDGAGVRVSGGWGDRAQAEVRKDRMEAEARRRTRPCITCSEEFRSDGPHNRMCNACRTRAADDFGLLESAAMPRLTLGRARA